MRRCSFCGGASCWRASYLVGARLAILLNNTGYNLQENFIYSTFICNTTCPKKNYKRFCYVNFQVEYFLFVVLHAIKNYNRFYYVNFQVEYKSLISKWRQNGFKVTTKGHCSISKWFIFMSLWRDSSYLDRLNCTFKKVQWQRLLDYKNIKEEISALNIDLQRSISLKKFTKS